MVRSTSEAFKNIRVFFSFQTFTYSFSIFRSTAELNKKTHCTLETTDAVHTRSQPTNGCVAVGRKSLVTTTSESPAAGTACTYGGHTKRQKPDVR